ncbi:MAG: tetratricopeptide repeat protein [Chloracidobacterium sp.]|nr:tetratricopeptide repeat protein [Chloracidobacterium sp.]MDW8218319.1 tetratricopeptide repeat protein [Acidobacteriota bacterium]
MGNLSFKTFLLGLALGAVGGYGVGRWLPSRSVGSQGMGSAPPAATKTAPPLSLKQTASLPADHLPLTSGNDADEPPAVAAVRRAADQNIGDYTAQMDAAAALYRAGKFADALAYAQRARNLRPDSLDALLAVGVSQAELKQYDAAVKTLEQAVARRPDDAEVRAELAYVHLRRAAFREALAEAERAQRLAEYSERALEVIAEAALALGDKARAKAAVARLSAVNPGNPRLAEFSQSAMDAPARTKGKP